MSIQHIHRVFEGQGYRWKFADGSRVPTEAELNTVVLNAIDALKEEEDNTQLEVGRLIVKKSGQFYDVYVHLAEYQ